MEIFQLGERISLETKREIEAMTKKRKRGGLYSKAEDRMIISLYKEDKTPTEIHGFMPNRSAGSIANRACYLRSKGKLKKYCRKPSGIHGNHCFNTHQGISIVDVPNTVVVSSAPDVAVKTRKPRKKVGWLKRFFRRLGK